MRHFCSICRLRLTICVTRLFSPSWRFDHRFSAKKLSKSGDFSVFSAAEVTQICATCRIGHRSTISSIASFEFIPRAPARAPAPVLSIDLRVSIPPRAGEPEKVPRISRHVWLRRATVGTRWPGPRRERRRERGARTTRHRSARYRQRRDHWQASFPAWLWRESGRPVAGARRRATSCPSVAVI